MKPRPDLLDKRSPKGIEVWQLTEQADLPSCHVYMEAQIFTPDSRRLLLHCGAHPHGGDLANTNRFYALCDLDNRGEITPLITEPRACGPSFSPDGKCVWYFIDEGAMHRRLTLKRVNLDGTAPETVIVVDRVPETPYRVGFTYPLSTISSDGKRIALQAYLEHDGPAQPPFGLLVFDLEKASVQCIMTGQALGNMHAQYCRSTDADASHDILFFECHGSAVARDGKFTNDCSEFDIDTHVIRDDGTNLRDMPWGRDGVEYVSGHDCWLGRETWAVVASWTPYATSAPNDKAELHFGRLLGGQAGPHAGHIGKRTPGAVRSDWSASFPGQPNFWHFGVDMSGTKIIADYGYPPCGDQIWLAEFDADRRKPLKNWRYLLDSHMQAKLLTPHPAALGQPRRIHLHPFLSPGGKCGFFNSNESGVAQAYMITGI